MGTSKQFPCCSVLVKCIYLNCHTSSHVWLRGSLPVGGIFLFKYWLCWGFKNGILWLKVTINMASCIAPLLWKGRFYCRRDKQAPWLIWQIWGRVGEQAREGQSCSASVGASEDEVRWRFRWVGEPETASDYCLMLASWEVSFRVPAWNTQVVIKYNTEFTLLTFTLLTIRLI